jgi:hypothetical protein
MRNTKHAKRTYVGNSTKRLIKQAYFHLLDNPDLFRMFRIARQNRPISAMKSIFPDKKAPRGTMQTSAVNSLSLDNYYPGQEQDTPGSGNIPKRVSPFGTLTPVKYARPHGWDDWHGSCIRSTE